MSNVSQSIGMASLEARAAVAKRMVAGTARERNGFAVTMAEPTIVEIPHQLGRAEVRRRMSSRVGDLASRIPGGMAEVSHSWANEDRMLIDVAVMGQKVSATVDLEDKLVRVTMVLPLMLSFMAGPITAIVRKSGEDLLLENGTRR